MGAHLRRRQSSSSAAGERRLNRQVLDAIADGAPVSKTAFSTRTGLALDNVDRMFDRLAAFGAEFDDAGDLVGNILTQNTTPHRFKVSGRQLYAWCALDTLFLPGLLEQTAEVESTCPVTGVRIWLTVAPDRVENPHPADVTLSVVLPGKFDQKPPTPVSGPRTAT